MPRTIRITEQRRDLSTRIARQRRRLDRRAGALLDQTLLVGSWRAYVEQHPARSLLAAAGAGMAMSLLARGGAKQLGRLGRRLYEAAVGAAWGEIWTHLKDIGELFGEQLEGESSQRSEDDA
ncbi:MAG: hypothetical protein RIC55_06410 [Pirellulaceae bacterium]